MKKVKLTLMYDGTAYCGWQAQPNGRSVQAEVERALSVLMKEQTQVTGASRTDAGVHANGYVCHFHAAHFMTPEALCYGLNGILPRDIRARGAEEVPESFHARYDAKKKTYIYYVDNSPFGNVFYQRYAWRFRYPLDLERMRGAARLLIGEHDFRAFSSSGGSAKTTVRTIFDAAVEEADGIYRFRFTGSGFLYNMVRIMCGTLVSIGNGRMEPDQVSRALSSGKRGDCGITAPPQGLFLERISYE